MLITEEELRKYLDNAINLWRAKRDEPGVAEADREMAVHYIDAFQSVHMSVFGELKPQVKMVPGTYFVDADCCQFPTFVQVVHVLGVPIQGTCKQCHKSLDTPYTTKDLPPSHPGSKLDYAISFGLEQPCTETGMRTLELVCKECAFTFDEQNGYWTATERQ